MSARDLLHDMLAAGFTLDLAAGKLLVTPASMLTAELRDALRNNKPGLIDLLTGGIIIEPQEVELGRTCADCQNLSPRGTCFEPVAAGLRTEQEGFGIAWPDEGQATTCQAFSSKVPQLGQERPHKLTREQLHAAHAEPWSEAVIVRFQARTAAIQRHGFGEQDTEDLAEQLHQRDVGREPMVMCMECSHYRPGRCGNHRAAGLMVPELARVITVMLQRCPGFAGAAR